MKLRFLFFSAILLLLFPGISQAWNYPRDGRFKKLNPSRDGWFFVDEENWDIKAPDKWQHFSGCYVAQKLLSKQMNKYASALVILSMGLYKEYEDAYREGWSARDMAVNTLGIFSAMYDKPQAKFFCTYDKEKVMLNLVFALR